MIRQMLQALDQRGHVEVGEICELKSRVVFAKALLGNGLKVPVIHSHTTHYDHLPSSRLQRQCHFQGLLRLRHGPYPGKLRIGLQTVQHLLCKSTKNNWDTREEPCVRCDHEPERFEPDCNDHVGLAIAVLADVPLSELLLRSLIRK